MKKILNMAALLGLCLAGIMSSVTASAEERSVTIKGSDTMVILGQRWAEVYMKKNPGATIPISATGVTSMRKIWDKPPTPARCSTPSLKSRRLRRRDQALDPIFPHFGHDAK